MPKRLLSILLILSFTAFSFGQTVPDKRSEAAEKLEKDAIEFLRDTASEVGRLRSIENRISFSSELASLMWFHDDKEAKAMYGQVVLDFKQLLTQFDAEMNTAADPSNDDEGGGFLFGGRGQTKIQRKFRIAMAVRQQIAMSLAEHAPDLAYNFFVDSIASISNPQFLKEAESSDRYFETSLMKKIAESDAAKGVAYGKESLKRGLDSNHIELLKAIYAKDTEKGIEFGDAILSKISSDRSVVKTPYFFSTLLSYGASNLAESKKPGAKKAIYDANELRDIAEIFAQAVLEIKDVDGSTYGSAQWANQIEKYLPGRAAQIRAKFKTPKTTGASTNTAVGTGTAFNTMAANAVPAPRSNSNTMQQWERDMKEREEKEKAERKMMDDLRSIGGKNLPKDERDKVIANARKIISETKGKDKKIVALSLLAAQVAKMGEQELADEIMRDAERMVDPNPKNYQDYLLSWMLASGYAEADPDKAFPLLESTILRANDTINAFVKVAEFIDVQEEMIDDGEVQVGMFGGSMIRELTGELGMASGTIRSLVKADFVKTKNLTNTFERGEVRVLARMMVLRAVLDKRTPADIKSDKLTDVMTDRDDPIDPR
ncbi:MAG: hypothetical protein IPG67_11630 [Acidobacteria bacterium]|nr:hypothetical protein [Acidobacteriota bacterium]